MIIEYVDRPVSQLVSFMKKAEQGDFRNKIEDKRKDEFGYLFSSYNQMIDKIDKLIQELYHEKLAKKEMEVKTLQQQINPHFLYNTLDTINWIAEANKIDSISKIVIALSQMYRITFQ
jgi:two-component system sensor histidine kinase YesM